MPDYKKETVISARQENYRAYLRGLWASRSLIILLARRDLKVKYAQSVLGVLWAVIQPLTGLLVFTFFFDQLIRMDTPAPYPVFVFTGIVAWFYFSNIVHTAGTSLVDASALIKKVYFPKLVLIFAKIAAASVELVISFALLFVLMLLMGISPGLPMLALPLVVLMNIAAGLSVAIWLSALTVRYRDFHHIIPYLVNYGIWLTPVFFPTTLIPPAYAWLIYLNPMAAVIAWYRWSLTGGDFPQAEYLISFIPVLFLLLSGLKYFRTIENKISDYV